MGGIYIQCGSFQGDDKSGSAIEGVLDELALLASPAQLELIARIRSCLDGGEEYAMIAAAEADALAPLLVRYRTRTEARIAPITNPFDQIEKDHRDDPNLNATDAKYGKPRLALLLCSGSRTGLQSFPRGGRTSRADLGLTRRQFACIPRAFH